jgi:hypothetical protein
MGMGAGEIYLQKQVGWIEFTNLIPDDNSLVIQGVSIPSSVIESWQRWFEKQNIPTRIEYKNGGRILYRGVDKMARKLLKVDRNEPCPRGSGKKSKKSRK